MKKSVLFMSFLVLALCQSSVSFAVGDGIYEAIIANVSKFNETGRCGGGGNFDYGEAEQNYLASKLSSWGYTSIGKPDNMGVEFHEWADSRKDSSGQDHVAPYGVDTADVALIYSHGNAVCDSASSRYNSYAIMGDASEECYLTYGQNNGTNEPDVHWGSTDLNVVIADTCKGVHKCVFDGYGYNNAMRSDDMSMLLGFHGLSYDGWKHRNHFEDFVDDSRYDHMGDNWVDEMTDWMAGDDECATAVVWGSSGDNTDYIYDWQGFKDFKSVGCCTMSFYYMENCDPTEGEEL